jgi:hypothetical protein
VRYWYEILAYELNDRGEYQNAVSPLPDHSSVWAGLWGIGAFQPMCGCCNELAEVFPRSPRQAEFIYLGDVDDATRNDMEILPGSVY